MYNNAQDYIAVKTMEALAKKARELVVPIVEAGLIKLFDEKCKMHDDKIGR